MDEKDEGVKYPIELSDTDVENILKALDSFNANEKLSLIGSAVLINLYTRLANIKNPPEED